jgi:hypothetical protein
MSDLGATFRVWLKCSPDGRSCANLTLSQLGLINDCDRVNLDQVAGGQRRYSEHHVRWLVTAEQRFPGLFDNWQAFVSFVVDDIDCDLGDMLRSCTGGRKCTAKIAKHLACLRCKITIANKHAIYVFGLLARNENQLTSRRNNDLAVRLGSR